MTTSERLGTEAHGAERALDRLPELERSIANLVRRIEPWMEMRPGARILDVGAAQGATVAAFIRAGFDAVGVEPWQPAIDASRDVAKHVGFELPIVLGWAEELPFSANSFDLVHAQSVVEHVDDVAATFAEAFRVLRPGGGFFFHTANAMCPRQAEIDRFPAFSWYPRPIKLRIMRWVVQNRPDLVGYTEHPAINWFTPWGARRQLTQAGFVQIIDRWRMRRLDEEQGWRRDALRVARHSAVARIAGDVIFPATAYLAIKSG